MNERRKKIEFFVVIINYIYERKWASSAFQYNERKGEPDPFFYSVLKKYLPFCMSVMCSRHNYTKVQIIAKKVVIL